ncbi:MAG: uroporphyrinogen-III synthase [Trueperaceae bacterium]
MKRPRIALTQSAGRLEGLAPLLEARGFEVVRRPLIETVPRTDARTSSAAAKLSALPWLLLTSPATVEALNALGVDMSTARIGAVGPATAEAATEAIAGSGGRVELVAVPNNADGLARAFLAHPQACGPVGLPRGNRALDTLERILGEAGIATFPVVVYDARTLVWRDGAVDAVVLGSPSAVEALPDEVARGGRVVTLGGTTSVAARARGWLCEEAQAPTAEATLAAVERVLV